MKFIGYVNAYGAWRETAEEYTPERGIVQSELIDLVRTAYSFDGYPQPTPDNAFVPVLMFLNGKFDNGKTAFAVNSLAMESNGDVVQTITTDQAEVFLLDLAERLDRDLGFRLEGTIKSKAYASNLVVEFDSAIETYIDKFSKMAEAINAARPNEPSMNVKRLAFGTPAVAALDLLSPVEKGDFVIERRVGSAFTENRYFCSAPLKTRDHIKVLEEIEAIAKASA